MLKKDLTSFYAHDDCITSFKSSTLCNSKYVGVSTVPYTTILPTVNYHIEFLRYQSPAAELFIRIRAKTIFVWCTRE